MTFLPACLACRAHINGRVIEAGVVAAAFVGAGSAVDATVATIG
jgi:hypothetical protein